ncbi:Gfo/Idh/MocA family oxidoreductase [Catenulispora sp. NL8]|uniref:Gfo/Idh/MocA family oxidoreductase n=1 Tax=Catenulispora pinistramenti TaxID=2705254 RepID=A0ABS5KNW7_9ACTN|nr:Gfo/Idh/MocA family oxidoreductase [Catenulispora pinistramenti]MBS2547748.1 Gfo/Idh/MocA family oxidoreductase [Catenulispora pinistramenti]
MRSTDTHVEEKKTQMYSQHAALSDTDAPYSDEEIAAIQANMPLLSRYAEADCSFDGWALLFRDHYVENSVGFVLGAESAGIPPEWIFAMAKGDQTRNRERIHATFLARGYRSTVFDNAWIDADPGAQPGQDAEALRAAAEVDRFIAAAREQGRKVLAIDDGGLIARGYGKADPERAVDAALELTVSGLKRIAAAGPLGVPVWNMARSRVKTQLGYLEIADSCMRRLRELIPTVKFIGRPVLLLGYGTLGSRLAALLRAQGSRVCVVDTDTASLITAAETGYCAHRTAADALACTTPFAVLGATGEIALTEQQLRQLPDGAYLAPFATKDFSVLRTPELHAVSTDLPGVGRRYDLPEGPTLCLLGDGRSLNLFDADAIPTQGYDAYRAGTLIAAKTLCRTFDQQSPGVHTDTADTAIAKAGLFEAYFDLYLDSRPQEAATRPAAQEPTGHACILGYGVAGQLHAQMLTESGMALDLVDPKHSARSAVGLAVHASLDTLSPSKQVDLWSVCTPTGEHLPILRAILARDPNARILLEKPACHGHEIPELEHLLDTNPHARVVVNDQYIHSEALGRLGVLIRELEPDQPIEHVSVIFTKDRRADVETGRFIDRAYGVLGYEWLHMLAVVRRVLPPPLLGNYFAADPALSDLYATYDERLFVSSLTERTTLHHEHTRVYLELASSITGPLIPLHTAPATGERWQRDLRESDDRHRHVTVHAGRTRFKLHLEPVTAPGGWQLDRNQHRLSADQDGTVVFDQIIEDSPMRTSIRHAIAALRGKTPPPRPDFGPLHRIAALAATLKENETTATDDSHGAETTPAPHPVGSAA